jgi:hypothetical protein
MIRGDEWFKRVVKSPYIEMASSFTHRNIKIYFSIDEIQLINNRMYFYEYKMIEDEYEDWFFKQALIQTAFYGALAKDTKEFKTASFIPNKNILKDLPVRRYSRLVFGENIYRVSFNRIPVLRFYLTKARVIANPDYRQAIRFDNSWKFKEWDWFKANISYKKIGELHENVPYYL